MLLLWVNGSGMSCQTMGGRAVENHMNVKKSNKTSMIY